MRKRGTLRTDANAWSIVLDGTGDVLPVAAEVRKKARKSLDLRDDDDGAVVSATVATRHAPARHQVVTRIEEVLTPSARQTRARERDVQEAARRRAIETRAREEARRQKVADRAIAEARRRRERAANNPALLRSSFRGGMPDVAAYTFLPYATNPPASRWAPAPDRTRPERTISGEPTPAAVRLSGVVEVTLDVRTPLAVFGDEEEVTATHRARPTRDGIVFVRLADELRSTHTKVSLRKASDGAPTIPGSSLKGALRSWFEAVTSSHRRSLDAPVAWRSTAIHQQRRLGILHFDGVERLTVQQDPAGADPARWPRGISGRIEPVDVHMAAPVDGEAVSARAERTLEGWSSPNGSPLQRISDGAAVRDQRGRNGLLKVGVSMDEAQVSVQIALVDRPGRPVPLTERHLHTWMAAHATGGKRSARGRPQLGGRAVEPVDATRLQDGCLVWYQLDENDELVYFGRLRNGRWANLRPLEGRVPRDHVQKSTDDDSFKFDPTHRVFGAVSADREDPTPSLAGRVRIAPANWNGSVADADIATYTLAPLASPKLSSAGLYLHADSDRAIRWTDPTVDEDDTAPELRGTKTYWHQPAPDGHPTDARIRLATVTEDGIDVPARTKHNASVEALRTGSFTTTISFEDLTEVEVGALLLAVTLRFRPAIDLERGWKLGIGKPLGLGSVSNRLTQLKLRRDDWLADPFASAFATVSSEEVDRLLALAIDYYLPAARDREIFDGIAQLDSVIDRTVGYLPLGQPGTDAHGRSPVQPNAWDVLSR